MIEGLVIRGAAGEIFDTRVGVQAPGEEFVEGDFLGFLIFDGLSVIFMRLGLDVRQFGRGLVGANRGESNH